MICDKTFWRASVQTVYFSGYLVGSIVMGILADKFVIFIFQFNNQSIIFGFLKFW